MSTVSEKLTQLANAIRSKSGATGKLSLDGMITAVNGITTGSGSSTPTYTMWGSQSLKPDGINAASLVGTYSLTSFDVRTMFLFNGVWTYNTINRIQVYDTGQVEIYGENGISKTYSPDYGCWYDEDELFPNDPHMLIIDIRMPITVSQDIYELFSEILDNGDYDLTVFDYGYNIGYNEGSSLSSGDLEALGVLCDWQVMMDSDSVPTIAVVNYHPSYYLHCDIVSTMDGNLYHIVVAPNSSVSHIDNGAFVADEIIDVTNVRWSASEDG